MHSSPAKVEGADATAISGLVSRLTAACSRWWLVSLISLLVVGAAVCLYFFIRRPAAVQALLGSSASFEVTYEFLLVTVVGGSLALLYKQLDLRREQRESLRHMHSELLEAYNRAKAVRRRMRARLGTKSSVNPDTTIAAAYYGEQMEALSEAQLIFEMYVKRTEGSLWFTRARHLATNLGEIDSYLNAIVNEYEKQLSTFKGEPPSKRIGDLKRLTEFIGPFRAATDFQTQLKRPIRKTLAELDDVILG